MQPRCAVLLLLMSWVLFISCIFNANLGLLLFVTGPSRALGSVGKCCNPLITSWAQSAESEVSLTIDPALWVGKWSDFGLWKWASVFILLCFATSCQENRAFCIESQDSPFQTDRHLSSTDSIRMDLEGLLPGSSSLTEKLRGWEITFYLFFFNVEA